MTTKPLAHVLTAALVATLGIACAVEPAAGSPAANGANGAGGGASNGAQQGSGGTAEAVVESVVEREPNDGPGLDGMQDIGSLDRAKTIKLSGRLDRGGNDGSKYTGDFDAFVFDVPASGGTLSATIDWTGGADVDAVLYDASFNPVAGDQRAMKPIKGSAPIPKGKYALVLFSKDQAADWTAELKYTLPASGAGGSGGTCVSPLQPENTEQGCHFELVEPANGAQIGVGTTFGFKSLGCETTIKMHFFGNPPTPDNSFNYGFLRGPDVGIHDWLIKSHVLTAEDLASLKSDNGVYHWQMESWYHSKSEARTFTIAPTVCK